MKSGMLAAEAAFAAMTSQPASAPLDLSAYETNLRLSWVSSSGRNLKYRNAAAR
jgi:flavin-dependent dehydrogenase